jgi:hypothetical protein
MGASRDHLHELVDRLPAGQIPAATNVLEALLEQELDQADRKRLEDAENWLKERGGKGIPMEDVLAEFGLTLSDFPLKK